MSLGLLCVGKAGQLFATRKPRPEGSTNPQDTSLLDLWFNSFSNDFPQNSHYYDMMLVPCSQTTFIL